MTKAAERKRLLGDNEEYGSVDRIAKVADDAHRPWDQLEGLGISGDRMCKYYKDCTQCFHVIQIGLSHVSTIDKIRFIVKT